MTNTNDTTDDEATRLHDTILRTALTDIAVRTAYIVGGITTTRGYYCGDHSIVPPRRRRRRHHHPTPRPRPIWHRRASLSAAQPKLYSCAPRRDAPMRVADLISWMEETLTVGSGEHAGDHITLLGWERKFLRGVLAPGVQEGAITISRANGKSTLLGALSAATLFGPEEFVIPGTEVVIFAASFTQAKIIFEVVLEFVDGAFEDRSGFKINDNEQSARIENKANGCRVRCLGSDSRRAHGIRRARLILGDEPAQWSPQVGERTYAALATTIGKVPGCRLVLLGTRPDSETHFFAKALDGGADYSQTHAARPGDPPFRWSTIRRANPSADHLPALAAAIRRDRDKARRDPAMFAAYSALRLNSGMSDTPQSHLLTAEQWTSIEGDAPRRGPCCWGGRSRWDSCPVRGRVVLAGDRPLGGVPPRSLPILICIFVAPATGWTPCIRTVSVEGNWWCSERTSCRWISYSRRA